MLGCSVIAGSLTFGSETWPAKKKMLVSASVISGSAHILTGGTSGALWHSLDYGYKQAVPDEANSGIYDIDLMFHMKMRMSERGIN